MAARRPYVRPMKAGWWHRNPFFVRYMAREMTAPFVALYALILLAGTVCLALGRDSWAAYVEALRSPPSLALHGVLVVVLAFHTYTWFAIMPKTMPPIIVAGRKVPAAAITGAGLVAAALCMAAVWLVVEAAT